MTIIDDDGENEPLQADMGEADPFMAQQPCPTWCQHALRGEPHEAAIADVDRVHFGERAIVTVRDLPTETSTHEDRLGRTLYYGHAEMDLRQGINDRAPYLHANVNGSSTGVDLTLDEADLIGRTLLALVGKARAEQCVSAPCPWIVVAQWVNSSPTYAGPFPTAEDGEAWAHGALDPAKACTSWTVETLAAVAR